MSLSLLFCFLIGCTSQDQPKEETPANTNTDAKEKAVDPRFQLVYAEQAIKVLEDGSVLEGVAQIARFYTESAFSMNAIQTLFSIKASDQFKYEIGKFESGNKSYKHVLITDFTKQNKRVFEFISEANDVTSGKDEIDQRRAEWIELCNQHDAQNLVTQLYSKTPIYYNHKPVVTDPESLIATYSYMNNPDYSLQLTPEHVELVKDDLAFEMGQCSGSYGGKYILIWKKDESGKWMIWIDSNI